MPPPAQGILFTSVSDVASFLGATGVKLRLDDDGVSTGAITAATNATPIQVTSASHGLTTGDLVQITGVHGNTWTDGIWFVTVVDANSFTLNTSTGSGTYTSGGTWYGIGYPQSSWAAYAPQIGTATVKRFVQTLYDASDLQNSWSAWFWSTVIGAQWLCARRGNPIPGSINNLYLQSLDELDAVMNRKLTIEDTVYRNECFPTWSVLRIDRRFSVKQMRVVASISGRTAPQFPRIWDLASQIIGPAELNSIQ